MTTMTLKEMNKYLSDTTERYIERYVNGYNSTKITKEKHIQFMREKRTKKERRHKKKRKEKKKMILFYKRTILSTYFCFPRPIFTDFFHCFVPQCSQWVYIFSKYYIQKKNILFLLFLLSTF